MHLVFWMTWWIDTYRSKDTLTRWIVGARGFSGKTRVTARSNVSHFLSVGIQASQPLGALGLTGPCVELLSFVVAEDQRVFGTTAFAHHRSHLENHMMNQTIYQGCLANF